MMRRRHRHPKTTPPNSTHPVKTRFVPPSLLHVVPLPSNKQNHNHNHNHNRKQITRAASAALAKRRPGHAPKTLHFGMQGEMGATVFAHPDSYAQIARQIRSDLGAADASILVGILLNHGYLPGVVNRGPDASGPAPLPASKMAPFSGGWGPVKPIDEWPRAEEIKRQLPAARDLLGKEIDFLGISNYARAPAAVQPADMESAVAK